MKRIFVVAAFCIVVIISVYYIWNSDSFQREVFPEKYWIQRIVDLEFLIKVDEMMIRHGVLEFEKAKMTTETDIAQSINIHQSTGYTYDEAKKMAFEDKHDELQLIMELVKDKQYQIDNLKRQLAEARQTLSQYQHTQIDKESITVLFSEELLDRINKKMRMSKENENK